MRVAHKAGSSIYNTRIFSAFLQLIGKFKTNNRGNASEVLNALRAFYLSAIFLNISRQMHVYIGQYQQIIIH